jgi:hypothetical protein
MNQTRFVYCYYDSENDRILHRELDDRQQAEMEAAIERYRMEQTKKEQPCK